ncbi:hypothetical protein ACHWQZ_G016937 [Mnemiopsis leidyi]
MDGSDYSWAAKAGDVFHSYYEIPFYHLIVELALVLFIIKILMSKSTGSPGDETPLTEKEMQKLIAEWTPEPLVPAGAADTEPPVPVITSKVGKYVTVNGKECLNLATMNFLGMIGKEEIEDAAVASVQKYGVGSCGPRGFYGTIDVHLLLEEKLAKYMECEEAIIYSYGFATVASAIPAYSKRGDIIFCDKEVCYAIQKGILASRSTVFYYNHNDLDHLVELLEKQAVEDRKNPKKARVTNRFLVTEGLFVNTGQITNLPRLIELKQKYKFRIFLDESYSFGVLGECGRGLTEYYNVDRRNVDMIVGSMEFSLGSVGGFACGSSFVIRHQRLAGQGYVFSASLPPLHASMVIKAMDYFDKDLFSKLINNCKIAHEALEAIDTITVTADPLSPMKHIRLIENNSEEALREICNLARDNNLAITVASYTSTEIFKKEPSIRLTVNTELTEEEICSSVKLIEEVIHQYTSPSQDISEDS